MVDFYYADRFTASLNQESRYIAFIMSSLSYWLSAYEIFYQNVPSIQEPLNNTPKLITCFRLTFN